MTTANKITLVRIGLVPFFVLFAVYYGIGVRDGNPVERLRWAAVSLFVVAAASDGLDGWVARRFKQRTRLGSFLDPIADKGLLMAGILTLCFSPWKNALPVWFGVLVIARDVLVLAGVVLVFVLQGTVRLFPRWTGKTATAFQMATLVVTMLQPAWLSSPVFPSAGGMEPVDYFDILIFVTALFTLVSGLGYIREGVAQVHLSGHGDPANWVGGAGKTWWEKDSKGR